jgi:hypothetical protein
MVREVIGLEGKGEVPFFIGANCVLLVRLEATKEEVLRGLDILKADLELRLSNQDQNSSLKHAEKKGPRSCAIRKGTRISGCLDTRVDSERSSTR